MSNFLLEAGRQTLMLELQEASRLPERLGDDFIRAAETIIHCEGKLIVSGIGKSGHIGKKLAATFASTGTPAFFVHPAEALHGDLGMLDSRDVMLFISYSGSAKELDLIVPQLEEKGIPLLAMTGKSTSPLALAAKAVLDIAVEREACPMHLAPTSSTTAALVMGDALAVALLEARGFTPEDFALSHPGGALGRKLLLRVNDIMHTGDEIPHVSKEASLRDALLEITRKNLGMTVVCDDLMKIQGIFTDGDLRRVFDMGVDVRTLGIADVMTPGGIRVRPGTLAVDVLNLMQSRHITSVMVADGDQLLGVVHMHDLLRAGVV